jgi:hypothetical protein
MEEAEVKQATFEGWAAIEMMGHRKEIGFVTTQAFGQAVLFRVDTPELPEREYVLEGPEYAGGRYCPPGTKVQRPASPAKSCLVAPAALYAINPCSEQAVMAMIERSISRPLIILELPPQSALSTGLDDHSDEQGEDLDDNDDRDDY